MVLGTKNVSLEHEVWAGANPMAKKREENFLRNGSPESERRNKLRPRLEEYKVLAKPRKPKKRLSGKKVSPGFQDKCRGPFWINNSYKDVTPARVCCGRIHKSEISKKKAKEKIEAENKEKENIVKSERIFEVEKIEKEKLFEDQELDKVKIQTYNDFKFVYHPHFPSGLRCKRQNKNQLKMLATAFFPSKIKNISKNIRT